MSKRGGQSKQRDTLLSKRYESEFEWGPIARGLYLGMIATAVFADVVFGDYAMHYILFVVYCGIGLRQTLIVTGLYTFWTSLMGRVGDKSWESHTAKRRREVEVQAEVRRIKKSREARDKLPSNW